MHNKVVIKKEVSSRLKEELQKVYSEKSKVLNSHIIEKRESELETDYVDLTLVRHVSKEQEEIRLEKLFEDSSKKELSKEINKVLVTGSVATGKSTLCQNVSYRWAKGELWKDKFDYIFILPLTNLTLKWTKGYGKLLVDNFLECFIHSCCCRNNSIKGVEVKDIEQILYSNSVLLILDGYNEIINHLNKKIELPYLILNKAIQSKSKNIKIIMTSQSETICKENKDFLKKFVKVENIGFSEASIYEYVSNAIKARKNCQTLSRFINSNKSVMELVKIPINLYLLCAIYGDEEELSLSKLHEKAEKALLQRYLNKHKERKHDKQELTKGYSNKYRELERLAYEGIKSYSNILTIADASGLDDDDLTQFVSMGTLIEVNKLPGKKYKFALTAFQEYMAAKYIARILANNDKEAIKEVVTFIEERKYEKFSENTLILLSGMVNKQEGPAQKYFWHIILNGKFDLLVNRQIIMLLKFLNEIEGSKIKTIPVAPKIIQLVSRYFEGAINKLSEGMFKELCKSEQIIRYLLKEKKYILEKWN